MGALKKVSAKPVKKVAPAKTPEAREHQLISLAVDLAEKQLSEGTASAQVLTHYLKLATTREKLEKEKLKKENLLLEAKTEALKSAKNIEELYSQAIKAIQSYSGNGTSNEEDTES